MRLKDSSDICCPTSPCLRSLAPANAGQGSLWQEPFPASSPVLVTDPVLYSSVRWRRRLRRRRRTLEESPHYTRSPGDHGQSATSNVLAGCRIATQNEFRDTTKCYTPLRTGEIQPFRGQNEANVVTLTIYTVIILFGGFGREQVSLHPTRCTECHMVWVRLKPVMINTVKPNES